MEKQFEILKKTRQHLLDFTSDLSVDQLNKIPEGFNNNIAWNLAHLLASQQGVCYMRAGLPVVINAEYFEKYKPGTKPETVIDNNEIEDIKSLFLSVISQLETDYKDNLFKNYTPWVNRYGIEMASIDDAISFIIFHEGLHLGYIMALKRAIK